MLGVSRELVKHTLNVSPTLKPIKKKLHNFEEDIRKLIKKEITQLIEETQ